MSLVFTLSMTEKKGRGDVKKAYYVTTAIAYPNAKPHIGHALEIVQADVVARFHRLMGAEVIFQTGTDEHGLKNWQTAQARGMDVKTFLDRNVAAFKDLYQRLNISYDWFLRTTDKERHQPGAQKLWLALERAGDIYKKTYRGLYCTGCESFKLERELVGGKCPDHPTREIETVEEDNYFFRLSKYREKVAALIANDIYKVTPTQRKNEILAFLAEANDISFSRPKTSLPWGIPVPGDEKHVMYVWCDALSNYITGAGYGRDEAEFRRLWPADCHIIGKDILRFHAAFWPAMLLSAGIALPKELFVHGFVLAKGGAKMSKSTGNVIDPAEQVERYGADLFRFYLLESMPIDADGEYDEGLLVERYNKELVSNVANLVYRTLSFTARNYGSRVGDLADDARATELRAVVNEKEKLVLQHYAAYEFRKAIQEILAIADLGNGYFQSCEPWKNKETSQPVLATCAALVKDLSILLAPILPEFSRKVQAQLGVTRPLTFYNLGKPLENATIGTPEIIWTKREPIGLGKTEQATSHKRNSSQKNKSGGTTGSRFPPEKAGISTETEAAGTKTPGAKPDPGVLDLIVAEIIKVEKHPNADKLYVETLDDGSGKERVIVSGLVPYYAPEELLGKHIVLVNNLKPAKLRGVESMGMLLAAQAEGAVEVLEAPWAAPGTRAKIGSFKHGSEKITIDQFFALKFSADAHLVTCEGQPVTIEGKRLKTKRVQDGKVA